MIKIEGANGFNRHQMTEGGGSPMPAVQASRPVKIQIDDGYARQDRTGKPAPTIRAGRAPTESTYRAPTMAEVNAARESNGFKGVSLFAGGGGSSTGWALAGFEVAWANEFVDHAAATYRANHPSTIVDQRDVRKIQAEEILEAIGMEAGELDFLDGSPPCDSFSTAGKRQKGWGKKKAYYGSEKRQRTDDLFFEYIRLLDGLRPRMFIAENVTGLIKGAAKGRFLQILAALKALDYYVEVKVLDAQWLGVPQCRQRVIFQGRREGTKLVWPKPHRKRITLAEALPAAISGSTNEGTDKPVIRFDSRIRPSATITASQDPKMGSEIGTADGVRKLHIPELKAICSFPPDYILTGSYAQQWAICGMSVPPLMMREIAKAIEQSLIQ